MFAGSKRARTETARTSPALGVEVRPVLLFLK
jgi:hypothetical protein